LQLDQYYLIFNELHNHRWRIFWDEGKGKVVAHIAYKDKPVIISRGGVGPNAGHTVQVGDHEYGVRMVPSGFIYKEAKLCIGSGVLVDPVS